MSEVMPTTLLIFKLLVQSSYAENTERGADGGNFDTVQWWFGATETWRVKTFAIDSDIHPHRIADPVEVAVAIENTMKHYGDVIAERHLITFTDPSDGAEVEERMQDLGGAAALEIALDGRFGFWNPDRRKYSSRTTPGT